MKKMQIVANIISIKPTYEEKIIFYFCCLTQIRPRKNDKEEKIFKKYRLKSILLKSILKKPN